MNFADSRQGFTWVSSTFAERYLLRTLSRDSRRWILSSPRGFFIRLSTCIHLGEFYLRWEVSFIESRQGFTSVNSTFAKRFLLRTPSRDSRRCILLSSRGFFYGLSTEIHLGEFYLRREVSLSNSHQRFTWVNSTLAEEFLIRLSVGIHVGEFYLRQKDSYRTLCRDSRRWILPTSRGFFIGLSARIHGGESHLHRKVSLLDSRQGFTWVNSIFVERFLYRTLGRDSCRWILPSLRGFFIGLSTGIHLGEFHLSWGVSYRTLNRDSHRWILPSPRSFFIELSAGIHLGEFYLRREVSLSDSRQGFIWVNSTLAEGFLIGLLAGIHGGESHLHREVSLSDSQQGFT